MRVSGLIIASLAIASIAIVAQAKTLRGSSGPAEIPPFSFKGLQYVDSAGCAYIRSGYAGKVTWVPRVQRNRQVVCGQKPSLVAGASKPVATPRGKKIAKLISDNTPEMRQRRFSWFQGNTRKKSPVAKPVLTQQVMAVPAPKVAVVRPAPIAVAAAKPQRQLWVPPVRRGPQANHPGDLFNGRLGRNGVASVQVTRTEPVLPVGYKSLLGDDMLASRRGFGTPEGRAAMDLLWTQTMPRRLIDVTTGRDMTAQLPRIVYPYVTASTRSYGAVSANAGAVRKRFLRDEASPVNMTKVQDVSAASDQIVGAKAAVKVVEKVERVTSASRFVQVATFGVPANAKRTLAKFSAGGLPTNSRPYMRKGKSYAIVLLGPFQDQIKLASALTRARKAGFSDAFYVD